MKLTFALASLALIIVPVLSTSLALPTPPFTISSDTVYDNKSTPLTHVACSDGENGLITKGFHTIGMIPAQYVGGISAISGWNSSMCGTCWGLTSTIDGGSKKVNILMVALDVSLGTTVLTPEAGMRALTGPSGVRKGVTTISNIQQFDPPRCGLK